MTAVVMAVVLGGALLVVLVWDLRQIVVWLVMAIVLALAVEPAVEWLGSHGMPRWLAASLITLGAVLFAVGTVAANAVPLVTESRQLVTDLPRLIHDLLKPGGPLAFLERFQLERSVSSITPDQVFRFVAGPRTFSSMFSQAAGAVIGVVTVVGIAIMLLIEGPRGWKTFVDALGSRGERVSGVAQRVRRSVGGYARGNALISLFAAISSFAVMSILQIPYALPLALAVGLLDVIPMVGATIGAVLCVLIALSVGWQPALVLIVFFTIYQLLENHLLSPVIYAKTVVMTPLTVLLVSLAGATLGGIVGVLLAIPLASAAQIAVAELLRENGIERLADVAEGSRGDGRRRVGRARLHRSYDSRDAGSSSLRAPFDQA